MVLGASTPHVLARVWHLELGNDHVWVLGTTLLLQQRHDLCLIQRPWVFPLDDPTFPIPSIIGGILPAVECKGCGWG